MTAMDDLNALLVSLPGYGLLTPNMKQNALNGARIPDAAGVWPDQPDYEATYDVYFAAISLIGFLQAQPVVRQSSSEGTSVAVDAPNWYGLLTWYRSMSPICQGQGNDVLTLVPIPDVPHVRRTDMSGRGDEYGDVDTDLG
ncbi:hypothetical protein SEA_WILLIAMSTRONG_8 [Microbacterium phage WilliamStrong]|nr:hypothetical protein SEA_WILLIAMSTRONG_8 [Microbacterium phage WilliamStrong]